MRIISGIFGDLKPLDLIKSHRHEMGTPLRIRSDKNLYEFWQKKIVHEINKSLVESGTNILLNLASKVYFSSIDQIKLKGKSFSINIWYYSNGGHKDYFILCKKSKEYDS